MGQRDKLVFTEIIWERALSNTTAPSTSSG